MGVKAKRKLLQNIDNLDQPLRFNPFVFSRSFLLWAFVVIVGGIIAGAYWIVLEFLTHGLHTINDWKVIPLMTLTGLMVGLIIKWIGDPGEIHLIVNNIKFKNGKLNPKLNPSMILTSLLCVSSGGSLGPEAPLVQVTGSTATWIGKIFRLKVKNLEV